MLAQHTGATPQSKLNLCRLTQQLVILGKGTTMSSTQTLVVIITLVVAGVFLLVWKRRDKGIQP